MKIQLDRTRCIGAGNCVLAAPGHFTQDDDGIVTLVQEHVDEAQRALIEAAVMNCPAAVISIVGDDDPCAPE